MSQHIKYNSRFNSASYIRSKAIQRGENLLYRFWNRPKSWTGTVLFRSASTG